jgi:hypothetical protein
VEQAWRNRRLRRREAASKKRRKTKNGRMWVVLRKNKNDVSRAYSLGTHARQDEDGLLLEFPCNTTRTCTV